MYKEDAFGVTSLHSTEPIHALFFHCVQVDLAVDSSENTTRNCFRVNVQKNQAVKGGKYPFSLGLLPNAWLLHVYLIISLCFQGLACKIKCHLLVTSRNGHRETCRHHLLRCSRRWFALQNSCFLFFKTQLQAEIGMGHCRLSYSRTPPLICSTSIH